MIGVFGIWPKGLAALAFALLLFPASPAPESGTAAILAATGTHEAITIEGDASFTAGNGVVAGIGTSTDPYVISGWNISSPGSHAFAVRNTTSSFVIEGCTAASGFQYGIQLWNASNGMIRNSSVPGSWYGLYLYESSNISIVDCDLTKNDSGEVFVQMCIGPITLSRNRFQGGSITLYGLDGEMVIQDNRLNSSSLELTDCDGGRVSGNVISLAFELEIRDCSNLSIDNNRMTDCSIGLFGSSVEQMTSIEISPTNTVNGLPVLFLKNLSGEVVDASSCGQFIGVNLTNVRIVGFASPSFNASWYGFHGGIGITVSFSSNISIGMCSISKKYYGISCSHSSGLSIWGNTITECSMGIGLGLCSGFNVSGNVITGLRGQGINIGTSDLGIIYGNRFAGLEESMFAFRMSNLSVVANNFETNKDLLRLEDVSNCIVYHNNFEYESLNGVSVMIWGEISNVSFDNGLPDGGNYWSGAKHVDKNKDGFSDQNVTLYFEYQTGTSIVDRYPLMRPYGEHRDKIDLFWIWATLLIAAVVGIVAGLLRPKKFKPVDVEDTLR